MEIIVLPPPSDGQLLSYLVIDREARQAAAVDPLSAEAVLLRAQSEGVQILAVLFTSKKRESPRVIKRLQRVLPDLKVLTPESLQTQKNLPLGSLTIKSLLISSLLEEGNPSSNHHLPHFHHHHCLHNLQCGPQFSRLGEQAIPQEYFACYLAQDEKRGSQVALFTGDILWLGGPGRLFEDRPPVLLSNMQDYLSSLNPSTQIYPGTDNAIANLKFCVSVDPLNQKALEKLQWAFKRREENRPAVPSTLQEELSYNPFLRTREGAIIKATRKNDPNEAIQVLRNMKKHFQT